MCLRMYVQVWVYVCVITSLIKQQESDSHTGSPALLISTNLRKLTDVTLLILRRSLSNMRKEVNDFMWLLFVWFQLAHPNIQNADVVDARVFVNN